MGDKFIRNKLLLGENICDKLANLSILVVGVGGVGGYAVESLVRLGVKHLTLVDNDVVDISNFNRQIIACDCNLNKSKVEAFKERILNINGEAVVDCKQLLYCKENEEKIFDKHYDYVIDAIDTLSLKWELIKTCLSNNIEFVSCMGMGNKLDLKQIEITTLDKTINDPVSKKLREFAKKDKINSKSIPVIFSKELPYKQNKIVNEEGNTIKERIPPASIIFTPAVAGLLIGQYILEKTIGK